MVTQIKVPRYDPNAVYEVDSGDVVYRQGGKNTWLAHVYQPRGEGPFPALLEVHGGAWASGDRFQNDDLDRSLASSGIVVAAIDFHLSTQAPYPAALADINYATRWLKLHAAEFNASAEAVGGAGFSSGGHQIMLSAMRPRDSRYAEFPLDEAPELDASLAYLILGWPVLDPHGRYLFAKETNKPNLVANSERFFGDEAAMHEGSPLEIARRGEAVELPPSQILIGTEDENLPPTLAEDFQSAYAAAGGIIEVAKYPGAPHGLVRHGGPNATRAVDAMKSFIARQLQAIAAGY